MTRAKIQDPAQWWRTGIIDIKPGSIAVRGYPIQDLIGRISFPAMIWLMLRGDLPSEAQARLLEAALVAAVDHGPQAPSIAIARMAITCGIGINGAMASGINALGDIHGGAGQQCMGLYGAVAERQDGGADLAQAVEAELRARLADGAHLPGFGHRFHGVDPRATRLKQVVADATGEGTVEGRFAAIAVAVEAGLEVLKGKALPMNIDGATAMIFCELGFTPQLGRGLFILSRSVGILAHAAEQAGQGERIKGPMPTSIPYTYDGPDHRRHGGDA